MTSGPSRYDRDPDALAWARSKVADLESRYRRFSQSAAEAGLSAQADMWASTADRVRRDLIGDGGR